MILILVVQIIKTHWSNTVRGTLSSVRQRLVTTSDLTLALHRAGPQKTSLHRTSLHAHCSLKILKALTLAQ